MGQLEKVWQKYKDQGFAVLAFPCNQFGSQEPWDEAQIKEFAQTKYDVSYPMFAKTEVNGPNLHPLYRYIKDFGSGEYQKDIRWNFTKFLLDRNGHVVSKYDGEVKPAQIEADIVKHLER